MALCEQDRAIIREVAEQNLNLSAAARALRLNRSAVDWRLDLILRETGLDARNFYDLCELLEQIREDRL